MHICACVHLSAYVHRCAHSLCGRVGVMFVSRQVLSYMKLCLLGSEGMRGMCYKKNITFLKITRRKSAKRLLPNTVLICDKIVEALVVLLSPILN